MHSDPSSTRRALTWVALILLVALACWQGGRLIGEGTLWPPDDFVEYYAAGRLNVEGNNPYDGDLLLPIEREAGRDTDEPIMMWNPPWTLAVAMPLGVLPARVAQLLWLALHLAIIIFCVDRLWRLYGGSTARRAIAWAIGFTFPPTIYALQAGQISPLILLGCVGLLVGVRNNRPWLAGASTVLMAIKPHLLVLVWLALAGWALRGGRWQLMLASVLTVAVATAVPLLTNPHVLAQYWEAMTHRTPEQWVAPTTGTLLRVWINPAEFSLTFVPLIPGVLWLAWYGYRHGHHWDWPKQLPLLIAVSLIVSPYGAWPFDMVLLLVPWLHLAANAEQRAKRNRLIGLIGAYVLIAGGCLTLTLLGISSFWFFWVAPAVLLVHIGGMRDDR